LRAAGYERVAVLGWSMGGSIVLRYAGLGGDADAVVSVSSPGEWYERGTRAMRIVHWLCETRSGRVACRVVRRTRLSPAGWVQVPESPAELVGRIAPTPLLIVHGDADHYFPLRHVDVLAAAAPEATVWVERGMAHAETATTPDLVRRIGAWVRAGAEPVRLRRWRP
jgi:pimeloyl-ACP methyl ester carboxylesterase